MSHSTDLRRLFAEYANGEITAAQFQTLEAALREDTDLRREFIEYMNVDSALGDLAALSVAEVAEIEAAELEDESTTLATGNSASLVQPGVRSGPTYRVAAIVGTVAVTLLFAVILWVANPGTDGNAPVATLVAGVNAAMLCGGEPWSETKLHAGEYRLDRGLLHLQFGNGVMVYVEAPARFDAVSGARLVLHSGRLSASVPPEGVGFTVETPKAEVTDFGTEFSVEVESGISEVHVFDGFVRVQPRSMKDGGAGEAVDLRTSQAVKIEDVTEKPVDIELARDRFIRNFDEPKRKYAHSVKLLSPVAYYRMPIRDRGLVSEPPQYSGVVLTGDGIRPPHARGVFTGGSLRVRADSTGRGGQVNSPPPLDTGQFTLAVFVYLETRVDHGTVATNIHGDAGNFALSLDENGLLQATIRNRDGVLQSVASDALLPLTTWCHLVMTADGDRLRIYVNGQLVALTQCEIMATSDTDTVWFGTDADALGLWNGRIDELALFDRAIGDKDIAGLYQAALEEMSRSE